MGKYFRHLTRDDRMKIEAALRLGTSQSRIARMIGVHRSTISQELKRSPKYERIDEQGCFVTAYSPELADERAEKLKHSRTVFRKLEKHSGSDELIELLEWYMADEHYSPAAALAAAYDKMPDAPRVSHVTLYKYIDSGDLFTRVTNKSLPEKWKRKRKYNKVRTTRTHKRPPRGMIIDDRPEHIGSREGAGHWEMDCIVSARCGKAAFLTLTERYTRYEIATRINDKTTKSVCDVLDRIEDRIGIDKFREIFKTITVDNGSEFSDCHGMEYSKSGQKRTTMYYCHPYSSWERGTNEIANRMVRRRFPKGTVIANVPPDELDKHVMWMNDYPREILGWRCAAELFEEAFGGVLL